MENSLYVALSRQVALDENMAIIANNVANINTPGFRGQNMIFEEFVADPNGLEEPLSMVLDYGHYQNNTEGPISFTDNPLDVALEGPGFFGIQTPDGVQYSRAGNFSLAVDGTIVNALGIPVANAGGGTLVIPPGAQEISIDEIGTVSTEEGPIGQIMVTEFENYDTLDPTGNGLYVTDEAGLPAQNTRVMQGAVEGSNVQGVVEMTRMIAVSREYQAVQNLIQGEHDRQRGMIQRLLRSGA